MWTVRAAEVFRGASARGLAMLALDGGAGGPSSPTTAAPSSTVSRQAARERTAPSPTPAILINLATDENRHFILPADPKAPDERCRRPDASLRPADPAGVLTDKTVDLQHHPQHGTNAPSRH